MAKSNPKKVKAKGGKKSTQRKENKKQQEDAKVIAELELRDAELDAVTGGASQFTTNTTNAVDTTNPSLTSDTKSLSTDNLGPVPHLRDALNLGLY